MKELSIRFSGLCLASFLMLILHHQTDASRVPSLLFKKPSLLIAFSSAITSLSYTSFAAASNDYRDYYAIKYRQTRYNELNKDCGKRKRNLENRRCFRRCNTDSDCRGSKRKCLCDGECGMSCIRLSTSCSQVGEFANGYVTYNPDNMFGSHLTYTCHPGYTLIGTNVRNCEGDGWWSGNSPICIKEVFCGVPPQIPNALPNIQINKDFNYKVGTEVDYQCEIGFVNSGSGLNKIYCEETQKWSETRFRCSKINCGKPPEIENGIINGYGYHYSDVVEYRCTAGFRIRNGDYLRECSLNGTWSGIEPSCEPINCGDPPSIKNSIINYDRTVFGSYAHYTCISDNYLLTGKPFLDCLPNGNWNTVELPSCIEKNCTLEFAEYSKPIYKIFSSNQPLVYYTYPIETEIRFLCQQGYQLIGPTHSTCSLARAPGLTAWSEKLPKCEPMVYCSVVKSPENGEFKTESGLSDLGYHQNTTLEFSCNKGYRLFGSQFLTCNQDGKWLGDFPYCIALPTTTMKTTTTTTTTATTTKRLTTSVTTTVPQPKIEIDCKLNTESILVTYSTNLASKIYDSNDFVFLAANEILRHEESSSYYCKSYRNTHYIAKCLNGTLIMEQDCTELPTEKILECLPPPQIANGYNKFGSFQQGSKVYYQCFTGYVLENGDKMLYCNNGKWIGNIPTCAKISCAYPGKLNSGKIMYIGTLDEYQYKPYMKSVGQNKQIRYECDSGYNLIGPGGSTCINGKWKPEFNLVSCVKDSNVIEIVPVQNLGYAPPPNYQHARLLQPEYDLNRNNIINYLSYQTPQTQTQVQTTTTPALRAKDNLINNSNRFKARRRRLMRLRRKKLLLQSEASYNYLMPDDASGQHALNKPQKRPYSRLGKRRRHNNPFSERRVFNYFDSKLV